MHCKMEEGLENSEQVIGDEISDHEVESDGMFDIEGNDLENDGDHILMIDSNDLENTAEQVLEFESSGHDNSEHVLKFGSTDEGHNTNQILEIQSNEPENCTDGDTTIFHDQDGGTSQKKSYLPPVVGMEFESYEDAYNYYNCYAKELGFAIRVKSSWTKRNSKEKRGAVLCCNCEGFKTMKEASTRRKETRRGCLAMIRLRLVDSNRWRVDEVKLEHNHPFDPERAQNCKSHKKMDSVAKRKLEPAVGVEVRTIKLYRSPTVDTLNYGSSNERDFSNCIDASKCLKVNKGDFQLICNFFPRMQLTNPNFFYIMDLNDEGNVRNVFWIDSRSRTSYSYFGDVVLVDTTCLSKSYEIPLVVFFGVNHHGEALLLGCGLLVDESFETYIWVLRAWLTCMSGRPPQTIITDRCKALQNAVSEVFPRAHHCLCLSLVMQSIAETLGELEQPELFYTVLNRVVYNSLKVDEFEIAWEEMVQHFGISSHEWLQKLYEDRERWAPVYLKDTFFAGMSVSQPGVSTSHFFEGFVHKETNLKEFLDIYELILQRKHQKEALDDLESKEFNPVLRTRCNYESRLSEMYTKEIFLSFQVEVEMMSTCFSVSQIHTNAPVITYMIKEQDTAGDTRDARNYEVMYDRVGQDVRCMCSCFNFKGYLCRHALCVLDHNGVEEIPNQYILSRWRKDFKRLYSPDLGSNNIDISNPVQWFDHLYRRALQVVEEGMASQDHYMVAWQAFQESLNKVRLVADRHG
ncbi:protein FAR1-RELATED SEQUENCE 8-like isoform X2 [Ipomoea triloba]|uniref:protein FAR1-RELATED SEQUENCE 8-like isoform X2 n=1 Tax=Ipomoea triloba TaxID=35885 RepID=UPI00125D2FA3|nr:protein FAR1-RELATED SEQUENCE 8-like isoform X2 [Ipomoea triloba]